MAAPAQPETGVPKPGQVVWIGATASVQFAGGAAFNFRVTQVDPKPTYVGWCWLAGYELKNGRAVLHRSIFVQIAGLRPEHTPKRAQARKTASAQR